MPARGKGGDPVQRAWGIPGPTPPSGVPRGSGPPYIAGRAHRRPPAVPECPPLPQPRPASPDKLTSPAAPCAPRPAPSSALGKLEPGPLRRLLPEGGACAHAPPIRDELPARSPNQRREAPRGGVATATFQRDLSSSSGPAPGTLPG